MEESLNDDDLDVPNKVPRYAKKCESQGGNHSPPSMNKAVSPRFAVLCETACFPIADNSQDFAHVCRLPDSKLAYPHALIKQAGFIV